MSDAPNTLPKNFDPAAIEAKWSAHWESTGAFRPHRPDAEPFTIVNPPPNVTGSLHMGHALDNTLQDILIRHARMQGKDALWVVGTDHAGIATQMVVERQMEAAGDKRTNYSREDFIAKVWDWKHESGGTITTQLRRLGCSMDWSREQFTMDPHFTKAVVKVFVDLYNQGLIYRDKRLVNWDPKLKTAISDLEVETREMQGHFWHFKYPLADGVRLDSGADHIVVATTRPETMLADMAVAVNAKDERYQSVIGKYVVLPITGRRVPIIADDHADPELGSGAVKITPGHDFNDFEVGKRAGFKASGMLNMFDGEAKLVQCGGIPEDYTGLDRFAARDKVVAAIDALGLLQKVEGRTIQTPYGDRSGVVIEPWLTDQWYVDAETLAKPAIEAVKSGAIDVVPKTWEKTYFNWMENIQPWCVSRQLWWGHRIPAWYGDNGKVYVAEDETAAQILAGDGVALDQDNDVLDTWFSSALWPFATLGWPDDKPSPLLGRGLGEGPVNSAAAQSFPSPNLSPEGEMNSLLTRHYPGDVLVSGFDILFFWDARMIMQGLHLMGEAPFKTLYLHGLVRAADGSKMSKSKGNTVDPLIMMDEYGTDALRFFMAAMESQGRDIKMDEKRVEGYRNFATKLWNAARFCEANGIGASRDVKAPDADHAVNRWIIGEVTGTLDRLNKAFAEFRFDGMADTIYHFAWGIFCDRYLELIKAQMDDETKSVAAWVFDQILVMLHPFMPFITEELWGAMGARGGNLLIHAQWPAPEAAVDLAAHAEINWVNSLIDAIRSARADNQIPPASKLRVTITEASAETHQRITLHSASISKIARVESWTKGEAGEGIQIVVGEATYTLVYESTIDPAVERDRISRAIDAVAKDIASVAGRLNNAAFLAKAKPEAVEKARADMAEKSAEVERLQAALARLG